jgi:hypothetical protein
MASRFQPLIDDFRGDIVNAGGGSRRGGARL